MKKLFSILALALLVFTACTPAGTEVKDPYLTIANEDRLPTRLSQSFITSGSGGEFTLTFATNDSWELVLPEWITASEVSGKAGEEIKVDLTSTANPNANDVRSGEVTIKLNSEMTKSFTVTQMGSSFEELILPELGFDVSVDGGEITLEVITRYIEPANPTSDEKIFGFLASEWDADGNPIYPTWVELITVDTEPYKYTYTLFVQANDTNEAREMSLKICNAVSCFMRPVRQAAN